MSNIGIDFWVGVLNIIVVIVLYIITYKKIDKQAIEREGNKREIPALLLKNCYRECMQYVEMLNQETVEKYIVPKIDFDSTNNQHLITNLQNSPFTNESSIMDLAKDGQMALAQIEGYFEIKEKYRQYVNMRIIFFDRPDIYEPLKADFCAMLNRALSI